MKNLKNIIRNTFSSVAVFFIMLFPFVAKAQIAYQLETQIRVGTIEELLVTLLDVFIIIATPIIVLFIIYSGFLYVTAKGNAQQIQQATTSLTYSIIGGVLVIGAIALSQIVKGVVDSFTAT